MIAAGPFVNIVIAFVLFFGVSLSAQRRADKRSLVRLPTTEQQPGCSRPATRLIAVDGVEGEFDDLREQIATHDCAGDSPEDGCEVGYPCRADDRAQRQRDHQRGDAGLLRSRRAGCFVGLRARDPDRRRLGSEAAEASVDTMWQITTGTAGVLAHIFDAEQREQISSVVGSYEIDAAIHRVRRPARSSSLA